MKIRQYTLHILINLILCSSFITAKSVIFDLGGVLVDTNKRLSFKAMGAINSAQYCFYYKTSPLRMGESVKNTLFSTLERVSCLHNLNSNPLHNVDLAYDERGMPLPYLMRAWLQGTMTCAHIQTIIQEAIAQHPEWFNHKAERRIIENLIAMIFTPEHFVATRTIHPSGIAFIKNCKKHGHQVYALSNWDSESFELLKQKYPQLFSLFDGIIISGDVHALKPNKEIYQILLSRYELDPEQCWFIDDQQENVNTAQQLGINGILHPASFSKLAQNIKVAYSKSVMRRENLKKSGINVSNTKNTSNAIIDGENISFTDSTNDNCLPANA